MDTPNEQPHSQNESSGPNSLLPKQDLRPSRPTVTSREGLLKSAQPLDSALIQTLSQLPNI